VEYRTVVESSLRIGSGRNGEKGITRCQEDFTCDLKLQWDYDKIRCQETDSENFAEEYPEWTPLQTHYFSENRVALGIEPGTSGFLAGNSDH
jgi:predicted ATP-binding protein involved in virulence